MTAPDTMVRGAAWWRWTVWHVPSVVAGGLLVVGVLRSWDGLSPLDLLVGAVVAAFVWAGLTTVLAAVRWAVTGRATPRRGGAERA